MAKKSVKNKSKKIWKKKGRLSARKQYQIFSREKHKEGFCSTASGGWMPIDSIKDSTVQSGYKALASSLG